MEWILIKIIKMMAKKHRMLKKKKKEDLRDLLKVWKTKQWVLNRVEVEIVLYRQNNWFTNTCFLFGTGKTQASSLNHKHLQKDMH